MVIGGRNSDNKVINSVEIYDNERKSWLTGPPLPEPVARPTIHEFSGDLLVIGGQSLSSEPRKIFRFGFKKGWITLELSPLPMGTFSAVSILVNKEFCKSTRWVQIFEICRLRHKRQLIRHTFYSRGQFHKPYALLTTIRILRHTLHLKKLLKSMS